jgi:hypothetical protein
MNKVWYRNFRGLERFLNGKRENYDFKAVPRLQLVSEMLGKRRVRPI